MIGDGGEEFSIVPVVYPCVTVSVSSLGYFLSVGSSYKLSHPTFPLSISEHATLKRISRRIGGGAKIYYSTIG